MGDHFEFRGKPGYLNIAIRPKSGIDSKKITRYDLSLDNLDDLQILLTMTPDEIVTVGDERMLYSRFKSEVLDNVHRIYPYKDGRLLDIMAAGTDKLEELIGRPLR